MEVKALRRASQAERASNHSTRAGPTEAQHLSDLAQAACQPTRPPLRSCPRRACPVLLPVARLAGRVAPARQRVGLSSPPRIVKLTHPCPTYSSRLGGRSPHEVNFLSFPCHRPCHVPSLVRRCSMLRAWMKWPPSRLDRVGCCQKAVCPREHHGMPCPGPAVGPHAALPVLAGFERGLDATGDE